jgi:DNA-binding transcriptional MerR regulator
MLELSAATIRTWETRYGLVVPNRSDGGQRLYSREQVEQLRFVREHVTAGRRPAEAHRLLSERLAQGAEFGGGRLCVLVAESRLGVADGLRQVLGADRFEVVLATDPSAAMAAFTDLAPGLVIIDTNNPDFGALAEALRNAGTKILPVRLLEQAISLVADARAVLPK